jgi:hypothetical protein
MASRRTRARRSIQQYTTWRVNTQLPVQVALCERKLNSLTNLLLLNVIAANILKEDAKMRAGGGGRGQRGGESSQARRRIRGQQIINIIGQRKEVTERPGDTLTHSGTAAAYPSPQNPTECRAMCMQHACTSATGRSCLVCDVGLLIVTQQGNAAVCFRRQYVNKRIAVAVQRD